MFFGPNIFLKFWRKLTILFSYIYVISHFMKMLINLAEFKVVGFRFVSSLEGEEKLCFCFFFCFLFFAMAIQKALSSLGAC